MNSYNAKSQWAKFYSSNQMSYPAEYVIRIFKGSYPKLNFDKKSFIGKKICDIGCGDGRNLVLLHECGFDLYGTEITQEIVSKTEFNLAKMNISAQIKTGTNDKLPFDTNFFDFLLSWNSCYYMGNNLDFDIHVKEMARILKNDGYLIMSIPKKTNFIFKNSEKLKNGYRIIKNDPFNIRNGEVLRIFEDSRDIENTFSLYFKNFVFASIHDDCFGYDYHWHIVICRRK
jgi:SAM-dependent methyltransferase